MNIYASNSINPMNMQSIDGPVKFTAGQIFSGKVHYIDSSNNALIQFGNQKMVARIEAPLDVQKEYWFEVVKTDGTVQLKVLENITNDETFLSYLQLPKDKDMTKFLNQWKQANLPLYKNMFLKAANWVGYTDDTQSIIETVKIMMDHDLPFTDTVFKSLLSVKSGMPISNFLENLFLELNKSNQADHLPVHKILQAILNKNEVGTESNLTVNWTNGKDVYHGFLQLMKFIGFDYEVLIKEGKLEEIPLKGQLLQLIHTDEVSSSVKTIAEQLLHKLIGTQLTTIDKNNFLQFVISLPIPLPEKMAEANFQFQGKKMKDNKLDPDYCVIILDLEMPRLGKIVTRMHVQNRMVSLHIFNEDPKIELLARPFVMQLKENLRQLNYQLASIKFENSERKSQSNVTRRKVQPLFQSGGFDLKI